MREDMPDVFHDCPKGGSRWDWGSKGERRKFQNFELDELSTHERIYRTKSRNCRSGPLVRFLESKLGQNWDEVYKEVAEVCDVRSGAQRLLLEYIGPDGYLIEFHTQMIGEEVCTSKGVPLGTNMRKLFYIHPVKNTLEQADYIGTWKRSRWQPKPYVKVDDLHQYHAIDGIWYLVEFAPYTGTQCVVDWLAAPPKDDTGYRPNYWDNLSSRSCPSSTKSTLINRYGSSIYPVKKTQCGKREIKKINFELEKMAKKDVA